MENSVRESLNYSKALAKRKYGNRAVKEYRSQSPAILQKYLLERCQCGGSLAGSWSKSLYGCVLFADISGFTKLASSVKAEDLKADFFTLLLGRVIKKYGGDVIKFCGDAILILWTAPTFSSRKLRQSCITKATECSLDLLRKCDHYYNDKMPQNVQLRLHCGISAGEVHVMALGNTERMECLISGPVFKDLGKAEAAADAGDLCMSSEAFELIEDLYDGETIGDSECFKVSSQKIKERKEFMSCLPFVPMRRRNSKKLSRVYLKQDSADDIIEQMDSGELKLDYSLKDSKPYKKALIPFVHRTARSAIQNNTSDHLAEIRQVVTMFIQIMNLDEDFESGNHQRPQLAFLEVLDVMQRLEGSVRQYVVDDKGCVIICAFGLPGCSSFNDSIRAVSAALGIRDGLLAMNISCRIGIAQGMVYCGYVGAKFRKEYCIMGSSVNLAARLMSNSEVSQVLVDGSVFLVAREDFTFEELPKIVAKGYAQPVQVFSPKSSAVDGTIEDVAKRSSIMKLPVLIGRASEIIRLQRSVNEFSLYPSGIDKSGEPVIVAAAKALLNHDDSFSANNVQPCNALKHLRYLKTETADVYSRDSFDDPEEVGDNKLVVVGCAGYGKTALITEIIRRNFLALFTMARLTCHVANMFEPYDVVLQIFKAVIMDSILDANGSISPILQASFVCDSNLSLTHDEDDVGDSECEEKSEAEKSNFEYQVREEVYTTIAAWALTHASNVTFEIVEVRTRNRVESVISMKDVIPAAFPDEGEDEDGDEFDSSTDPLASPLMDAGCHVIVHTTPVDVETLSEDSTLFTMEDMIPLMRICFNANPHKIVEFRERYDESVLQEIVTVLAAEILRRMVPETKSHALVVEDLQWCDRPSFQVLMKMLKNFPTGLFIGSMRPSHIGTSTQHSQRKYARIASFEGTTAVNSIDDISEVCQLVSLQPFGRADVKAAIEHVFGDKLLAVSPEVLSDQSISSILAKSDNGVIGAVFDQIRVLESDILKAKYGTGKLDNYGSGLQQFDRLNNESQVVLKMACVCGTSFTVAMLTHVLSKMGYVAISSHVGSYLRDLEDKGMIKRVFAISLSGGGHCAAGRSFSERRMGILSHNCSDHSLNEERLYTFLNKKFRESVYSVMLESQRAAVHAVIGAKLQQTYESGKETLNKSSVAAAEAVAFHFSKAHDLANEVKYSLETAEIAKKGMMSLTALEYLNRVLLLATEQRSCAQLVLEHYQNSPPSPSVFDNCRHVLTRTSQFGNVLSSRFYIPHDVLKGAVHSVCPLISDQLLSDIVAEMSVLEYMQCELTNSHNYAVLAQHMRHLTSYRSFPRILSLNLKDPTSRLHFCTMFFHQGDLCFMRGQIDEALKMLNLAAALVPHREVATKYQIRTMLATVELFGFSPCTKLWSEHQLNMPLVDRTKMSYSYINLHSALMSAVSGDFYNADMFLKKAATRVLLRKDCSPLKAQILNMMDWVHFVTGKPSLVIESLKTINGEDNVLKKIWSIELLVIVYALEGRFLRCYELLQKLKTAQCGRYGAVYREALVGMVGVMESKHLSPIVEESQAVISALLFAAGKLTCGLQVCPIGAMSLFWTTYAIQSVLHPATLAEIEMTCARGDGTIHRLREGLKKCLNAFSDTTKYLPFLATLNEALLMKQAVLVNTPHKKIQVETLDDRIWQKYPQFVFGRVMWTLEWQNYYGAFIGTVSDAIMSAGIGSSDEAEESFRTFGIHEGHFLRRFA